MLRTRHALLSAEMYIELLEKPVQIWEVKFDFRQIGNSCQW